MHMPNAFSQPRTPKQAALTQVKVMRIALYSFLFAIVALFADAAFAAPPAGASIGNQASATYSDDSAVTRTVTSNTVTTIVQQVASLTFSASGAKTSNPSGQVAYPHTLTNTGNGTDTFALATSFGTKTFDFTSVSLYADANGDGVPDNSTPITSTGELCAGCVFKFVAVGTVPSTAVAGNSNQLILTATSQFPGGVNSSNTDTTTITANGVVSVTQSLDVSSGPSPAGPRTITLTYTNTGNTTVTALKLVDDIPSGMTYVANSGRWSVTGSGTVLTDANNADNQSGIVYDVGAVVANRMTATIASVAPGASGTVTFQVNVNSGLPSGANATTALTANYAYNDGSSNIAAQNTNTVQYTVNKSASVTVSNDTVASSAQGGTVMFTNVVTNTGNGTDTFNMSTLGSTFPAGTTFQLFRADGLTPLTDSNNDGLPDTGPLAAAGTTNVIVKATLPGAVSGSAGYAVSLRATSTVDGTKTGTGTDTLTAIAANSVDLTNDTFGVGAPGYGPGPVGAIAVTNPVAPGGTTRFTLIASNNSGVADSFNLSATTDGTFASTTLPAGWTVVFHDANGAVITNTGVINAGQRATIYADVTAPANATTGFDLYFRTLSPSSGISDGLHDAVTVSTQRSLVLTPNNTAQAISGGTVVFTHTIVNTGTAIEGDGGAGSAVALTTASTASFTSIVYWDKNNDGVLDVNDPVVTSLAQLTGGTNGASTAAGLSPGETARLFVKVTATPGAANGLTDTTTLTATVTGSIGGVAAPAAASASDTTTVITSNLTLVKKQSLDVTCDGIADNTLTNASLGAGAVPGSCIRYEITATNAGGANVTALLINDFTPANTKYHGTVGAATTRGTVTSPANGAAGAVQADVGTLAPGQTAVLTFGVRIDP